MVERYTKEHGVPATLLYPLQGPNATEGFIPVATGKFLRSSPTFAYAGTLTNRGYASALSELADVALQYNGRILIYGPVTRKQLQKFALDRANVALAGLLGSQELIKELRERADILFLPMSFDPADRTGMELCFPSKLADYTSVGLPILVYGPPYCSAVRWARENPGAAEVVQQQGPDALRSSVQKLVDDHGWRSQLAKGALAAGSKDFSYQNAMQTFYRTLFQEK
jgi:glycosyltransferase involved in cell wall biosynthesis